MNRRKKRSILSVILITSVLAIPSIQPSSAMVSTVLPSWAKTATIYEVNVRQYTSAGTFNAFAQSLPRLKSLGVKILWFMPIQPISVLNRKGSLGSEYSVANYTAVNPEFGTSEDFKNLVNTAHSLGFKIILDWVADHTGWDNPWITNKNWYHQDSAGNIISPEPDWSDVAWLDYSNQDMRAAMLEAMKYWVTQYDIDGFRADDATGVPSDFWSDAIQQLDQIKPMFMLAEAQGSKDLLNAGFNSDYGWNLLNVINEIGAGKADQIDVFVAAYADSQNYPTGTLPMTFITNHDENTNTGSEYARLGGGVQAMSALYFTYPGIPLIYSGQEVGNTKQIAFFDKDLIPGLTQANSTSLFYSKLIALKNLNAALWNTATDPLVPVQVTNHTVVAYSRSVANDRVVTVVNASNQPQTVTISFGQLSGKYKTFISVAKNGSYNLPTSQTITLKPWQYQIYSTY